MIFKFIIFFISKILSVCVTKNFNEFDKLCTWFKNISQKFLQVIFFF